MSFRRFLTRRIILAVVNALIAITLVFLMFRLLPGDPTATIISASTMTPEERQVLLSQFGLDKPLYIQYFLYMQQLFEGNWGRSFFYRVPVIDVIAEKVVNTLLLAAASTALAYTIGLLGGAILTLKRNSKIDSFGTLIFLFLRSTPMWFIGMFLVVVFAFWFPLFPTGGMRSIGYVPAGFIAMVFSSDFLYHLFLPAISATLYFMGMPALLLKSSTLSVMNEDFVDFARAKGLSERSLTFKHIIRNSLLPVVTSMGVHIALSIGGIVMIEYVFSWPGVGSELVHTIFVRDYPVAQGIFLALILGVSIMNILVDLVYSRLDPRVIYK